MCEGISTDFLPVSRLQVIEIVGESAVIRTLDLLIKSRSAGSYPIKACHAYGSEAR